MCKVKTEKVETPETAPAPQVNAATVATPTLDMSLSNQQKGKKSLSLRRQTKVDPNADTSATTGLATTTASGLGTK